MTSATTQCRLAVDIGGTFTDVVLELPNRQRVTYKLLTTYDHPGNAVLEGIDHVLGQAGVAPSDIGLIIHGTTLATNALIERRGAKTALLTTAGHRDALEMAHEDRFEQYDINIDRPKPLVPRHLRLPVTERLNKDGEVLIALDEQSILNALPALDEYKIESVAIGYLHGFVNPDHEQKTAEILLHARPDLSVSLASEVAPEIREFERLSTTCANAYVRPLMARYLKRLAGELKTRGFHCPFFLMTSGGGLTTLETATRFPIRLVESGPAGGAILARQLARQLGLNRMLSFDMGGTTAKLCLIDDGEALTSRSFEVDRVYRFKKGSGLPVRIPVIEMVEIGAGGGSIASVDKLQRIQVGPESAGSEPGPAAYNRGGERPTVTDADVCLGKVVPERFAFDLNLEAAKKAVMSKIGETLNMNQALSAFSISEIVDENMAAAARAHAAEFGMDLGSRDIVAFGGAAPLHAARLGQKLGAQRIIIPGDAGVGSAVGFLLAPVSYEVVRSRQQLISRLDQTLVSNLFSDMRDEALSVVEQASRSDLIETRHAYMRYVGQGHELCVELPNEIPEEGLLRERFENAYRNLYGHTIDGVNIEVLSWTLTLSESTEASVTERAAAPSSAEAVSTQTFFDPTSTEITDAPVYLRHELSDSCNIAGPALITEDQTTTVVPSGFSASINTLGCIVMEVK
ncbi:MAG: hydantoinase/oxoprolinase family protein [Pseudomonadales bacterium]|nr:hydantoinase/oxoprolinase family protein [Pseudomonadales bacterium]